MSNNSFFIGWQKQMPQKQRKLMISFVSIGFLLLIGLIVAGVSLQTPVNNHVFEFSKVKTFTGRYHKHPVPMLEVEAKQVPEGHSPYILLVGYGKFGAEGIMEAIEKQKGTLDQKKVELSGTLIYGDGKTLLELTDQENSLKKVLGDAPISAQPQNQKEIEQEGEIIDPKCYFGVMKPALGKVHRACAVRCISGGIPPVLHVQAKDKIDYYILLGQEGQRINQQVLPYVAEHIALKGQTYEINGWKFMNVDLESIKRKFRR